jgi:beta-lactamase class A
MGLEESIQRALKKRTGVFSVLVQELGSNEALCSINADMRFVSASVIKVPIMLCALEEARLGNLSLSRMVAVRGEDILSDTICLPDPREASVLELATWMIINSDNTSTNVLIDLLGFGKVNALMAEWGLKDTVLMRKMLDFQAVAEGRNNHTSNRDMFLLYNKLFREDPPEFELRQAALSILRKQRDKKKLPRYIWEDGVEFAHKTGGLDYLCHDSGVMAIGPRKLYVGVFTDKCSKIDGYPEMIGEIGRLAYDHIRASV